MRSCGSNVSIRPLGAVVLCCVLVSLVRADEGARHTAWGDPDLQGVYSNNDERLIPLERPAEFARREPATISQKELMTLSDQRREQELLEERRRRRASEPVSPKDWTEASRLHNSRAWLLADPPDGHVPAVLPDAVAWVRMRTLAAQSQEVADPWKQRSLWERCITRGLPGSMMPEVSGNAYQIVQSPGYVAIRYEMVHETRLIPLDGRPHIGRNIRQYMGDARGRWENGALLVETTNFTAKTDYPGRADRLRIVERFTRTGPRTVEWAVTFDDPDVWATSWTFAMNLTEQSSERQPLEYACHEGNYALANILSASGAAERATANAR